MAVLLKLQLACGSLAKETQVNTARCVEIRLDQFRSIQYSDGGIGLPRRMRVFARGSSDRCSGSSVLLLAVIIACSDVRRTSALDIYVDPDNGTTDGCCQQDGRCRTLNLALECLRASNGTTVWIRPGAYHFNASGDHVSAHYQFVWMKDIAIVAQTPNETSTEYEAPVQIACTVVADNITVNNGAGLTFLNSVNVTIRGIMFDGCGVYHFSSSHSEVDAGSTFFKFFTALYFMLCRDVTLEDVHVNGTNGIGAVMYSTVGSNLIKNCTFSHNAVKSDVKESIQGGGGLYIEFSYCLPINADHIDLCDSTTNVPPPYASSAWYSIEFTEFIKNNATVTHATDLTFILPHLSNHVAFGRGGGLSVFFKGNAFNNTVFVTNSTFTGNEALWGAGLFVEYQDNVQKNTFEIHSSHLDSNLCHNSDSENKGTGGGGARIGYIFFNDSYGNLTENSVKFVNVAFDGNRAYFGGGLSFYTAREPNSPNPTNFLSFSQCLWMDNVARVGSAADISVWHPVAHGAVVKPTFTSCTFINNSALYTDVLGTPVGIGALYIDSIPIAFVDGVWFISNTQTALASISTGIYFEEGCHTYFVNNHGRNGGAIALMGNAFIRVSKNTEVRFYNNYAELKGGAIFGESIGEHDLISSRNCIIRYEDVEATPENWIALFKFENNTVANGRANSIHITSLLTCLWGGAFGSTESIEEAAHLVFCWKNNSWVYSNSSCSHEISTSPAHFNTSHNSTKNRVHKSVIPGMKTNIAFGIIDDRDGDVTDETVFTAKLFSDTDDMSLDNNSLYISDQSFKLYGQPGTEGVLRLETIQPRVISTEISVTLQQCPPGMYKNGGNSSTASCQCGVNSYNGYIICNSSNFTATILRGYWIGHGNDSKSSDDHELLVGPCIYCEQSEEHVLLPRDTNELSDHMCKKVNRKGVLCGQCLDGYGPVVNGELECQNCTDSEAKYHWVFYLLTEFLPIAIFFLIVIFFNVSATSGPANAFVFFAQVITLLHIPYADTSRFAKTFKHLYTISYDIWNLNFFHPWLPKFCLSSKISSLQLLSTGYVTALFPLLLVVIFYTFVWLYSRGFAPVICLCRPVHYCFARFHRIWNIEQSVIHALATFLLLSYTKFSVVSFYLLTPAPLLDRSGNTSINVLYYDGTIRFFEREHIPYIIPSFIILLTFVLLPPLVLMLPSLSHLLRVCLQKTCKYEGNVLSYQVGSVTGQFMRAFHECYKDGTGDQNQPGDNKHDFRWFAGMYFVFRFTVYAVIAFTPDDFTKGIIHQVVFVGGLLAFAVLRPYKNDWYNKWDASVFAILTIINSLLMYNYFLTLVDNKPPSLLTSLIIYVLILCPLVYMIIFVICYLVKKYSSKVSSCVKRMWPFSIYFAGRDNEEDNRDFIEYTEETGRLRGEMEYSVNIAAARDRQRSIMEELNRSAGQEEQVHLLRDEDQEKTEVTEHNSNQSSGYGATGSASLGLSDNSNKDEVCAELPSFGVERMKLESNPSVADRRKRLFRTQ